MQQQTVNEYGFIKISFVFYVGLWWPSGFSNMHINWGTSELLIMMWKFTGSIVFDWRGLLPQCTSQLEEHNRTYQEVGETLAIYWSSVQDENQSASHCLPLFITMVTPRSLYLLTPASISASQCLKQSNVRRFTTALPETERRLKIICCWVAAEWIHLATYKI